MARTHLFAEIYFEYKIEGKKLENNIPMSIYGQLVLNLNVNCFSFDDSLAFVYTHLIWSW